MARPRFRLRLRDATDAVSPVIGVILMVAITVVLAATVFLLVNDFSEEPSEPPQVTFDINHAERQVRVLKAEPALEWVSHLTVDGTCAGQVTLNGVAWPPPAGTPVRGGDALAGCDPGQTLLVNSVNPSQLLIQARFA